MSDHAESDQAMIQRPILRVTWPRILWAWFLLTLAALVAAAAEGSVGWMIWDSFLLTVATAALLSEYGVIAVDL